MAARSQDTPFGQGDIFETNNDIRKLHSQLIQALSAEIAPGVGNNWNEFKNSMAPHLTATVLATCNDMFNVVPELMKSGKISYGEYKILSDAFKDINHFTCERIVAKYTGLIHQKQKEQGQKEKADARSSGQKKIMPLEETGNIQISHRQGRLMSVFSVNSLWIVVLLIAISMSYYSYVSTVKNLEKKLENLQKKCNEQVMSKQGTSENCRETDTALCNEEIEMKVKPLREKLQYLQQKYEEFIKSKTDPSKIKSECMENVKGEVMKKIKPLQEEIQSLHQARDSFVKTENGLLEANDRIMAKLEGVLKSSQQIAFSAYAGRDLKNLRLHDIIVFDSIIINIGSAYDSNTGVFRCPEEDGLYFITATTFSFSNDEIETEIVRNGENIPVKLYAGSSLDRHNQGTNSAVVLLTAGDRLYVRVNFVYPKKKVSAVQLRNIWSTFTAFRIN